MRRILRVSGIILFSWALESKEKTLVLGVMDHRVPSYQDRLFQKDTDERFDNKIEIDPTETDLVEEWKLERGGDRVETAAIGWAVLAAEVIEAGESNKAMGPQFGRDVEIEGMNTATVCQLTLEELLEKPEKERIGRVIEAQWSAAMTAWNATQVEAHLADTWTEEAASQALTAAKATLEAIKATLRKSGKTEKTGWEKAEKGWKEAISDLQEAQIKYKKWGSRLHPGSAAQMLHEKEVLKEQEEGLGQEDLEAEIKRLTVSAEHERQQAAELETNIRIAAAAAKQGKKLKVIYDDEGIEFFTQICPAAIRIPAMALTGFFVGSAFSFATFGKDVVFRDSASTVDEEALLDH